MSNINAVGRETQNNFGNYRIAVVAGQTLAATGNAVVALPVLAGGIQGGSFILRRITVSNPSNIAGGSVMNIAAANITILTSNDGNTSNAVTTAAGQTLGNVTAANTWQDLTLVSGAASTAYTANALFVKVGTAVANAAVNISVFGDVVTF